MNDLNKVVEIIKSGGVVCFPTDTAYALSCDATNPEAVATIFEIKGRDKVKALPVFVKDLSQAQEHVEFNDKALKITDKFWPGQVTLVLPKKEGSSISPEVSGGFDSVGVRMPGHKTVLEILSLSDCPLVATSANLSGTGSLYNAKDVIKDLGNSVDFVLDGLCGQGSSTVVKVSKAGALDFLRVGNISKQDLTN